jgi:hypothetical protein
VLTSSLYVCRNDFHQEAAAKVAPSEPYVLNRHLRRLSRAITSCLGIILLLLPVIILNTISNPIGRMVMIVLGTSILLISLYFFTKATTVQIISEEYGAHKKFLRDIKHENDVRFSFGQSTFCFLSSCYLSYFCFAAGAPFLVRALRCPTSMLLESHCCGGKSTLNVPVGGIIGVSVPPLPTCYSW